MNIYIVKETTLSSIQIQEIKVLVDISNKKDNTGYVFDDSDDFKKEDDINNFLFYGNNNLLGFISIFAPKKTEAELIAIIEPENRRKGYFNKLLVELVNELKRRKIYSMLFVCDYQSKDGNSAAVAMGSEYEYSEFLMNYAETGSNRIIKNNKILVIKANRNDMDRLKSISKNAFHSNEEEASGFVEENFNNPCRNLYNIWYEDNIVGMIGVYTETDRLYIYGFCIDDEYQGRGIGRQSLTSIVKICQTEYRDQDICLEVQTDNKNALGLYRNAGFEIVTEFKYYRKKIIKI